VGGDKKPAFFFVKKMLRKNKRWGEELSVQPGWPRERLFTGHSERGANTI